MEGAEGGEEGGYAGSETSNRVDSSALKRFRDASAFGEGRGR